MLMFLKVGNYRFLQKLKPGYLAVVQKYTNHFAVPLCIVQYSTFEHECPAVLPHFRRDSHFFFIIALYGGALVFTAGCQTAVFCRLEQVARLIGVLIIRMAIALLIVCGLFFVSGK